MPKNQKNQGNKSKNSSDINEKNQKSGIGSQSEAHVVVDNQTNSMQGNKDNNDSGRSGSNR